MPVFVESGADYEGENNSLIAHQDRVPDAVLTASSEQASHPVENVSDGLTFDFWKPSATGAWSITVDMGSAQDFDYVGIAAHNLSSESNGDVVVAHSDDDATYTTDYTLSNASITDDSPILIHLVSESHRYVRVSGSAASTDLAIGILFVGELLQMQRRIYVGNPPPRTQRADDIVPSLSEGGQFLGRLVARSFYEPSYKWENLTAAWYRANFQPFVDDSRERPFFLAWRPADYPSEVVFGQRTGNIMPSNDKASGHMSVSLSMRAVTT